MNLDVLCAECGHAIVQEATGGRPQMEKTDQSKLEGAITKSLGVLQEDGVYAFFLFLAYFQNPKESKDPAKLIEKHAKALLRHQSLRQGSNTLLPAKQGNEPDDFNALRRLCNQLDHLLLTRQLLEQSLIYARYHAKSIQTP